MDKIPCIKCDLKLWNYIKPYLIEWGYISINGFDEDWDKYPLLVINVLRKLGIYNNLNISCASSYDRELVTNVEEFLERAAALKGFTYKRKNVMKINGIEIKPGMGIYIDDKYDNKNLFIVIPTKTSLAVINYGKSCHWSHLDAFLTQYEKRIVAIYDIANEYSIIGDILWEAPKEIVLTMDEIAKKFGYDVSQIKIKK